MNEQTAAAAAQAAQATPEQAILQMMSGFWVSQTLFATHSLGVHAALADAPATADELATNLGLHPQAGKRLLTAAVALGLLEINDGKYSNSPLADATLVPGRPHYTGGFIAHGQVDLYPLWGHLDSAVRENRARWEQAFGATNENPFDQMYADPERLRAFLYAMRSGSLAASVDLLGAYDFSQHTCLLDVGGALGTISVEVAKRNPHLKAITFDLPPVTPFAAEYAEANGVADRVSAVAGDMFADELPKGADVAHMSWILHDWDDERSALLLRKCFDALPSGGVMLLGEALMNDDGTGPLFPALMSLNMLVATDGGRERTEGEYRALLEGAGFVDVRAHRLSTGMRDLVVARKP